MDVVRTPHAEDSASTRSSLAPEMARWGSGGATSLDLLVNSATVSLRTMQIVHNLPLPHPEGPEPS